MTDEIRDAIFQLKNRGFGSDNNSNEELAMVLNDINVNEVRDIIKTIKGHGWGAIWLLPYSGSDSIYISITRFRDGRGAIWLNGNGTLDINGLNEVSVEELELFIKLARIVKAPAYIEAIYLIDLYEEDGK